MRYDELSSDPARIVRIDTPSNPAVCKTNLLIIIISIRNESGLCSTPFDFSVGHWDWMELVKGWVTVGVFVVPLPTPA